MAYLPRHRLNRCSRAGSVAPRYRAQVSSSVDEWPVLNFWFQLLIMSLGSQLSQTNPHSKWSWMCHWSTFRLSALEIRSIYIHIKSFTRSQWGDMVFFFTNIGSGKTMKQGIIPLNGQGNQNQPRWPKTARLTWMDTHKLKVEYMICLINPFNYSKLLIERDVLYIYIYHYQSIYRCVFFLCHHASSTKRIFTIIPPRMSSSSSSSSSLVGGFNPSEKYEIQLGWFIMENNPFMFQTTNQIIITCTEWMVLDSAWCRTRTELPTQLYTGSLQPHMYLSAEFSGHPQHVPGKMEPKNWFYVPSGKRDNMWQWDIPELKKRV